MSESAGLELPLRAVAEPGGAPQVAIQLGLQGELVGLRSCVPGPAKTGMATRLTARMTSRALLP